MDNSMGKRKLETCHRIEEAETVQVRLHLRLTSSAHLLLHDSLPRLCPIPGRLPAASASETHLAWRIHRSRQLRCSWLSAAVMLTSCSFWGQIARLPKWIGSRDTPCARISTGAPCFLAVRQRPPEHSLVHRASFSSNRKQLARGPLMAERELIGKDKLLLRGLQFHGFHGVKQEEKTLGQKFVVDVDAWMDLSTAGETDSMFDTVSYTDIYRIVKDVVEGPSRNLLESVAHQIASSTLLNFPQISAVRVKVGKPHVAVQGIIDYLGVEILRYRKDKGGNSSGASLS
ncbi:uncharacterized protein LOC133902247 isoform X2 [Phragmites australis]|uniref:uncharacterized protein LOC133902247 isoform X2 n=1 Tax=Phragmites australis TaxID=29695 RepID=UPI002D775252|nr:uncharacterized protein LOC133902247 isoform X2 [Phragmites australis]